MEERDGYLKGKEGSPSGQSNSMGFLCDAIRSMLRLLGYNTYGESRQHCLDNHLMALFYLGTGDSVFTAGR